MKNISLLILLFLIISCSKNGEDKNIYSIDDYFEAYFQEKPSLHKRFSNNYASFSIYNYNDEIEGIQYVALYGILKRKPDDNKNFLLSYIHGLTEDWGGNMLKYELIEHEGNDEILYVTESERNFEQVYEFGVVAIKSNVIYQWVVEERDDMSKADKIFGKKLKYFKVLK